MFLMDIRIIAPVAALVTLLVCQHSCNGLILPNGDTFFDTSNQVLQRSKREPEFDPVWIAETAKTLGHKLDTEKYKRKLKSSPPRHRLTIKMPEN